MKAFPSGYIQTDEYRGMDLRDYFAAKAMQAIISNDNLLRQASEYYDVGSEESIAILAYEQAHAMMEARK
jgi:hypothetical protein